MAEIDVGFRGRLAYLRWLDARGQLTPPSDREFAASLGLGESWVRKWKGREDAPERRTEQAAFERRFGAEATRWLYDAHGTPPEPAQWAAWLKGWKAARKTATVATGYERLSSAPAAKKKKGA